MSDELFKQHCKALEEGEYADVFRLLNKLYRPKPRLVLVKSIVATKRKPIAPKKPVLLMRTKQEPSDRELLGAISDACARGWISGTDGLAAQRLLEQGQPLPKSVRAAILGRGH